MKLALSYTASATDASDTLISAPDAALMTTDTVFQISLLSHLKWEVLGLQKEAGWSKYVLSPNEDRSSHFKLPTSQPEVGNIPKVSDLYSSSWTSNQT